MGCMGMLWDRCARSAARARTTLCLAACLAGLSLTLCGPPAQAQSVDEQVAALNQQAMDAYNQLEVDRAAGLLDQALQLASASPLALKMTYMNLAVVHIDGLQNNGPGGEYLVAALCVDPNLQLDPLTSTPNIQAAYTWAQEQIAGGACGTETPTQGAGTTPPPGAGQLGDECAMDTDCGAGLLCREFYCSEGGGDGPPIDAGPSAPTERRGKVFFRLGLSFGASLLSSGMPADSGPADEGTVYTRGASGLQFNEDTPWVPDADSSDQIGRLGGDCAADGTETDATTTMPVLQPDGTVIQQPQSPSSYCVRLNSGGFAGGYGIRLAGGMFFTDDFSGALLLRIQPDAGEGTLSNLLIGARGEYWLGPLGGTALLGSVFGGVTVGQIQAQPSATYDDGPYVTSGPLGIHGGLGLRYPLGDKVAFYAAPELVVLFPDLMLHLDFTLVGVEATF